MRIKLSIFVFSLFSLAEVASAENYDWLNAQHVCSTENASWIKADGSAWGAWTNSPSTFFITFAACDITEEAAANLGDHLHDPCRVHRVEGELMWDDAHIAIAKGYQGMYTRSFRSDDLWIARSDSWFPKENARNYQYTAISSDAGNATSWIGFDGSFKYSVFSRLEEDSSRAWFTLSAQCAPVFNPN